MAIAMDGECGLVCIYSDSNFKDIFDDADAPPPEISLVSVAALGSVIPSMPGISPVPPTVSPANASIHLPSTFADAEFTNAG